MRYCSFSDLDLPCPWLQIPTQCFFQVFCYFSLLISEIPMIMLTFFAFLGRLCETHCYSVAAQSFLLAVNFTLASFLFFRQFYVVMLSGCQKDSLFYLTFLQIIIFSYSPPTSPVPECVSSFLECLGTTYGRTSPIPQVAATEGQGGSVICPLGRWFVIPFLLRRKAR